MNSKIRINSKKLLITLPLFVMLTCLSFLTLKSNLISSQKTKDQKLNVLLITIDTLRADRLSCYTPKYLKTPNIDALAETGVLFSRAFAHTTVTLPSHANILLGTTPLYHGVHENMNFTVSDDFYTLAEHLKIQGYATGAFIGAYPLDARYGLAQGFDTYDDNYDRTHTQLFASLERTAEEVLDPALNWLQSHRSPWFQWIHIYDPHDPYDPPEPFKTKFKDNPYEGEVAYVDAIMGKLFAYLKDNDLLANTLIVFTADHGESLGDHGERTHGFFAYNTSLWIPLIISYPGVKVGSNDQNVSHIDIYPTICDVLKIDKPGFLQGASLHRALRGKKLSKKHIYFESLFPYYTRGWAPLSGYIYQDDKFIESPIPEFYDLKQDFDEQENLADTKKLSKNTNQLNKIIEQMSSPESKKAEQQFDRETQEKLASLGYISSGTSSQKESFGPSDDIKVLLPYNNKATQAMDLSKAGNVKAAFKLLREVITDREDMDIAYHNLAKIYKSTGQLAEALTVLQLGHEKVPSSYLLFFAYVNSLIDAGEFGEIIRIFNETNYRQTEYDPEIWNIVGIAHYRSGDLEKAIASYEQALALENRSPVVCANLAEALLYQSAKIQDPGMFQQAIAYYQKAIEIDPEYHDAYNGLGKAFRFSGRFQEAINAFQKALELNPEKDESLYHLSMSYFDMGDKESALKHLTLYKNKYYGTLTPELKKQLDALIEKCKES